ncbi:MAG: aminopeptidase N [Demequinaceae bacterium]|nr:aminopeptidase N [Demequinaceae bacterium]
MPGQNLTRAEAEARATVIAVDSYEVTLDLTTGLMADPPTFRSTTVVRFGARAGESSFIDLIAPAVHSIDLNGEALSPAQHFQDSRIALPDLKSSNVLTVVADCAYMNTGEGLHRFVDPEDDEIYLYSQFEVADTRRVFPVFEQPNLKAMFQFTVTAPDHWHVLSNSPTPKPEPVPDQTVTIGKTKRGLATWAFEPTGTLPCYVTAIVAGPYHKVPGSILSKAGRLEASVYCRKPLAEFLDADVILDVTQKGFDFYEELFEMPYPFPKYDQIFVPEFNAGAMENAGCVTFTEDYVFRSKVPEARRERRVVTVLHELSHMWFGDLVTMKWWDDLWLNESFAEYVSTLATAETIQGPAAWTTFNSLEKAWAYRQDQLPSTHPIVATINDLEDVEVNFDGITYAKGASVLKQLVAWVGREDFFAGVAEYFRKHHRRNTTLRDLLIELEKTSGRDLEAWSGLWLEKAGVTTLRPDIEVRDDGVITGFAVTQEAPKEWPTLRPHRLGIGGYDVVGTGAKTRLKRSWFVETDIDGALTDVPDVVGKPRPALLLVNDDDLAYAKIRLDHSSLATAIESVGHIEESLPRSMVLAAAWDMTRDAEMPARSFVDLVLKNVGAERESTITLMLLRQLATAIDLYVEPRASRVTWERTADALWTLAKEAASGSDNQLQFVRAFAGRAHAEAQLDAVEALLQGTAKLEGLAVDTDLGWDLLIGLVAGGRAGTTEIKAMLKKDATASGERRAAHARAAIPTAKAKRAAWDALINAPEGADLPNALQSATTAGFNHVHDTTLLEPFIDDYFGMLRRVYETKTNEMATNLIEGLYPVLHAGRVKDLQDRTDAWLEANKDAHPALRRLIIEGRDGVRRSLTAQHFDTNDFGATNSWPEPPLRK